jgi:predicted amidohydrolase
MPDNQSANPGRSFRGAVIQLEPVFGQVAANLALIERAVRATAADGAELMVLPELCTTGYVFADRAEAQALAEPVTGRAVATLAGLAAELGVHLIAGVAEQDGAELFNSAVLIGPGGLIGTYRKVHLWNNENTLFEPGNAGLPVFDTDLGRLGLLICYDLWFPEASRALAVQGSEIICVPTTWVPIPGQRAGAAAMAITLCQAAAHVNSVYVLAADRCGVERGQPFIGQSVIVAPTGWPEGDPASATEPGVVTAMIDPAAGRRLRTWNDFNDPVINRRPEVYAALAPSEGSV